VLDPAIPSAQLFSASLTLFHIVESIFIQSFEDEFSKTGVLEAELLEEMKLKARSYSEELAERLRSDVLGVDMSQNRESHRRGNSRRKPAMHLLPAHH
jgi:hypothetical protein